MDFRHVLYTGHTLQLVLMALKPGQDIGAETHARHDQFFRVKQGRREVMIDGATHSVRFGAGIVVPAGAVHTLINTGDKSLKVCPVCGPPISRSVGTTEEIHDAGVVDAFR